MWHKKAELLMFCSEAKVGRMNHKKMSTLHYVRNNAVIFEKWSSS
jgi:hypothetical protein